MMFAILLSVIPVSAKQGDTPEAVDWTIAIDLCGTDLESGQNSATSDLLEIIQQFFEPA